MRRGAKLSIIVQAGGEGTRMQGLTKVKPKALIPIKGKPVLFHLFDQFPEAEFSIIGDYKYEVLEAYLATFAGGVNYRLLRPCEKGNAAGIRRALEDVPEGRPVLLIWSDLMLAEEFRLPEPREGCQVGVVDFPCSRRLLPGGSLAKEPGGCGAADGVAGMYYFDTKAWLRDLPEGGSFFGWLQSHPEIPLHPLPLPRCTDLGTLSAYQKAESTDHRCRPYNRVDVLEDKVIKTALTEEAAKLIEREVAWYRRMAAYGFSAMPRLLGTNPLTLERIQGGSVFLAQQGEEQRRRTLDAIITAVLEMHSLDSAPASAADLRTEYYDKTLHRLQSIRRALPFADQAEICINGTPCANLLCCPQRLLRAVESTLMGISTYCPIHGDCQLTNTLLGPDGRVYFIDARGYFGSSQILGDARYDWAKIYYAIAGNFDQFNVKRFSLDFPAEGGARYSIASGGWEHLVPHFTARIPAAEANLCQIRLIHAIIWLSMASHAWEDYDSMCVAFLHGLTLFHEWELDYDAAQ